MNNNASNVKPRTVLVVDDDPDARWLVVDELREHGFEVVEAENGLEAQQRIEIRSPDLVVLDLGLPLVGGLDLLKSLRVSSDLPVIIVTGRGDRSDRVVGLELGADDYVVKPFDPRELVARVNAVLRRGGSSQLASTALDYGQLVIDPATRDVSNDGQLVDLTAREFDLLLFLASSPRQVFTREQILDNVWNSSPRWQNPATVNEHVHRLRRKIEPNPSKPKWITTMRGAGYRFTPS